jgi:serine/threonine protein kinase
MTTESRARLPHLSDDAVAHLMAVSSPLADERYEIVAELGRGGMGIVHLARDLELDRDVALKVLNADRMSSSSAASLLHEARVVARLEHPGIVPIYDAGTLPDGRLFYVMRRVRGRRLDAWLEETAVAKALSTDSVSRLFLRICEPIAFAHDAGVLHRDLKPQNIMVGAFGEVLVMDWGLAKSSIGPRDAAGTIAGTPGYMAPEQSRGEVSQIDVRTDVYALGRVLTDLVRRAAPSPRQRRVLGAICAKASANEPDARYESVAALVRDVSGFLAGEPVSAYRETLLERASRLAGNHRAAIVMLVAYLSLRLFFILFR